MKKKSIFIQFYFILVVILIVPMILVLLYSTTKMTSYYEETIGQAKLDSLVSVSSTNELRLFSIIKNVLRVAKSSELKQLKEIPTYEILNESMDNVKIVNAVYDELYNSIYNESFIHSINFYKENSDYIISTDKGIVQLDNYRDITWLTVEKIQQEDFSGIWKAREMSEATVADRRAGRNLEYTKSILSYVFPVKTSGSGVSGDIVVNIYEEELYKHLNPFYESGNQLYIYDKNFNALLDEEKENLGKQPKSSSIFQKVQNISNKKGWFTMEENNRAKLIAYYKSSFNDWTYISIYDLETLMQQSKEMITQSILLHGAVLLIGILISFFITYHISKPFRKLLYSIRSLNLEGEKEAKNEFYYLSNMFDKMKHTQEELSAVLIDRNTETKRLLLRELLAGASKLEENFKVLEEELCFHHFIVAYGVYDNANLYMEKYNEEERYLHFDRIQENIKGMVKLENIKGMCIQYNSISYMIVLNMKSYDNDKTNEYITQLLHRVKEYIYDTAGFTMSFGISGVHDSLININNCSKEAIIAVKKRIVNGKNSITFWNKGMGESKRYHYPYGSEKKILNYMQAGDYDSVIEELHFVKEQILSVERITYDNVLMIYHQLIGATIKYLMEHNINTSRVFGNGGNVYSVISNMDTIDEIDDYLVGFYQSIGETLKNTEEVAKITYDEKILNYLDEHYKEDIDFEKLADTMGISYSYMRKLIKNLTGNSLIDYINKLRIDEAKVLLLSGNDSVAVIAEKVGYHNVQSINRFFKKYEGLSPREYRQKMGKDAIEENAYIIHQN